MFHKLLKTALLESDVLASFVP